MYEKFYRFLEKPFSLTPDPKFLYLSKQHQGALDHMVYGIDQREGFMAIVGDVGTGKTTLCRCLLDRLNKNIKVALILNPMLSDIDLLRTCLQDLGVRPLRARQARPVLVGAENPTLERPVPPGSIQPADLDLNWTHRASKKQLIDALNAFLLKQHKVGGSTVLIIDEAQNLSLEVMEQLRILSNLETEKEKLLQIIFVGQLELMEKLQLPALKQLNQRISVRYQIAPMSKEETRAYIDHRLFIAGGGPGVTFIRSAMNEIYRYSAGYPRLINLVCDRALLAGYNEQTDTIGGKLVRQAVRSLLGEEEKSYLFYQFFKGHVPLVVSVLFFMAGLAFFIQGQTTMENLISKIGLPAFIRPEKAVVASLPPSQPVISDAETGNNLIDDAQPQPLEITEPPAIETDAIPEESIEGEGWPEEPPAPVSTSPVAGKDYFRIQVYSLSTKAQAEESVVKLKDQGYTAYWKKIESTGQHWYVVYIGPFKEIQSAKIHLNALKHIGLEPMLFQVSTLDGGRLSSEPDR